METGTGHWEALPWFAALPPDEQVRCARELDAALAGDALDPFPEVLVGWATRAAEARADAPILPTVPAPTTFPRPRRWWRRWWRR